MTSVLVINSDGTVDRQSQLADVKALAQDKDKIIWVDFDQPPAADQQALLQDAFGLGQQAVDHLSEPHRGPRAIRFRSCALVVIYDVALQPATGVIQTYELVHLIGERFLVTSHSDQTNRIPLAAQQIEDSFDDFGASVPTIVFAIASAVVDGYFSAIDGVRQRVEALRRRVLDNKEEQGVNDVYQLTNELGALRRVIAPEQDLIGSMKSPDGDPPAGELSDAFLDLSHDMQSATGEIDQYSNVLSNLLDTYESLKSDALNQLVKRLTVLSILVALIAIIPTVMGISLNRSPFSHAWKGYSVAVILMLLLSLLVWGVAKRIGWLK